MSDHAVPRPLPPLPPTGPAVPNTPDARINPARGNTPRQVARHWHATASLDILAAEPAMRDLDRCELNAWGFRQRRDRRFVFVVDSREPCVLHMSAPIRFAPSDWTGTRPMLGDPRNTLRGWATVAQARRYADAVAAGRYVYLVDARGLPTAARGDNVDRLGAPSGTHPAAAPAWPGEVQLRDGVAPGRVLLVAAEGGHHLIAAPADVRSLLARPPGDAGMVPCRG